MIRDFIFYLVIFFILWLVTKLGEKFKLIKNFVLLLYLLIFLNPIKNIIILVTKEGIPSFFFLLILGFTMFVSFYGVWIRKRKKNNLLTKLTNKFFTEVEKIFTNLIYFNQHTYYIFNTKLILLENIFRPLIKNPYSGLVFVFTFLPSFVIIISSVVEIFYYNKIKVSFILFILSYFIFRLFNVILNIISKIAENSVTYYHSKILFRTFTSYFDRKQIMSSFLNQENLKKIIFSDNNVQPAYILRKFTIIYSILHFSRTFLLIKVIKNYLLVHYKLLSNTYLFLIIGFFLMINWFLCNFFKDLNEISKFFLCLDIFITFFVINYYYFYFFVSKKIPYSSVHSLLYLLLIDLEKFISDLKIMYLRDTLVSSKINDITPVGILVSHNPKKPQFLSGFNDILEEDMPEVGFNYIKFFRRLFISFSFIFILYFVNEFATNLQNHFVKEIPFVISNIMLFFYFFKLFLQVIYTILTNK